MKKGLFSKIIMGTVTLMAILIIAVSLVEKDVVADRLVDISALFIPVGIVVLKMYFDKDKDTKAHLLIFDEVAKTNDNVGVIRSRLAYLQEKIDVIDNKTAETGEIIKDSKFTKSITIAIDRTVIDIVGDKFDVNSELYVHFAEAGKRISEVVTDMVSSGFDNFNPDYFKVKLMGQAKVLRNNLNYANLQVEQPEFESVLKKEVIYPAIDEYIRRLNLAVINLNNGVRRAKVKESTIEFVSKLVNHTLQVYDKLKEESCQYSAK